VSAVTSAVKKKPTIMGKLIMGRLVLVEGQDIPSMTSAERTSWVGRCRGAEL
jgi:hypothetical protein